MLVHFYKFSHRMIEEPIVKTRRFSLKYSNDTLNNCSTDHKSLEYAKNKKLVNGTILKNKKELAKVHDSNKTKKCIIKCRKPLLNFYENQIYPKFEPIPLASRGWHHRKSRGDHFTIYPVKNNIKGELDESVTFKDISLNPRLLKNLEEKDIHYPTTIQRLSIPKIINGDNIIMTAETGCGKTIAYLLPMLHQIIEWKSMLPNRKLNSPFGLIITPSFDLTHQIHSEAQQLSRLLNINIMKFVGGETSNITKNPPVGEIDLIIASLGILSKLMTWQIFHLNLVRYIVLDEADVLLDPTFRAKMCYFLEKLPIATKNPSINEKFPMNIQLTLSSATVPENLTETLHMFKDKRTLVPVTSGNEHQITVEQKFLRVLPSEKTSLLLTLIKKKLKSKVPIIIFSNTIKTCDFISQFLNNFGINCLNLHGDIPHVLKKTRFREFHQGKFNILSTTDAAARGLDTVYVQEVINYDFPLITSEYIHRCGRTGRIGSPNECRIINFICSPTEIVLTSKIEFAIRKGKPIPMIDIIHEKNEQENEFLNYKIGTHADINTVNQEPNQLQPIYSDGTNFDTKFLKTVPS